MFDDDAPVPTLPMIVGVATQETSFGVSTVVPRLVAYVQPRPSGDTQALLPVVRPLLEHQFSHPGDTVCILADYQLLLSGQEPESCASLVQNTASSLLSLGVDPRNMLLCRESDLPPLTEVYWLLSCLLHLPTRFDSGRWTASRNAEGDNPEQELFLAAVAIGLGATRLVLDSELAARSSSFVPLLREIERRLERGESPIQVLEPTMQGLSPAGEPSTDARSSAERLRSLRHDSTFLRDVLEEGAMVASGIVHRAITGLRQHFHLNDRGEGRT